MKQTINNPARIRVKRAISLLLCLGLFYFIFPLTLLAGGSESALTGGLQGESKKSAGFISPAAAAKLAAESKSAPKSPVKIAEVKKAPALKTEKAQLTPTKPEAKVATGKVVPTLIPAKPKESTVASTAGQAPVPGVKKIGDTPVTPVAGGDRGDLVALADKPVAKAGQRKISDSTKTIDSPEGAVSPDSGLAKAAETDKLKPEDGVAKAADPRGTERLADAAKKTEAQMRKEEARQQVPPTGTDPIEDLAKRTEQQFDKPRNKIDAVSTDTGKIEQIAKRADQALPDSANPAFKRMSQPPTKFRRFADTSGLTREMTKRLTGEIKPAFSRLSNLSDRMVSFSPKLINTEINPKLAKMAGISEKVNISSLANQIPSQLNSKFQNLATISPNKFNLQSQFKGVKIAPQLASLGEVTFQTGPSVYEVKSYQVTAALEGLNRFLPEPMAKFNLPDSSKMGSANLRPALTKLSDLSRLAGLKSTEKIAKTNELKSSFVDLASLSKNSDKILVKGLSPIRASSLRIIGQQKSFHQLKTAQLKTPKIGYIRLLHGDNGSRLPAIQALEASGISVQDLIILNDQVNTPLLVAGDLPMLNPLAANILEADGQMSEMVNSILLSSDAITKQLLIKSIQ